LPISIQLVRGAVQHLLREQQRQRLLRDALWQVFLPTLPQRTVQDGSPLLGRRGHPWGQRHGPERGHGEVQTDPQRALRELDGRGLRSEEHTSELQSRENLVCRLLLEKKKGIFTMT